MASYIDIYGITKSKKFETINNFIAEYVDRDLSENRGDEELMILYGQNAEVTWEPARDLTSVINKGLLSHQLTFSIKLISKQVDIAAAYLTFTKDEQIVLGLSIEITGSELTFEQQEFIHKIFISLISTYHCYMGLVSAEQSPPHDEVDFMFRANNSLTVFFFYFM